MTYPTLRQVAVAIIELLIQVAVIFVTGSLMTLLYFWIAGKL